MTVAYHSACPQLESAFISKRTKHDNKSFPQHSTPATNPRLKGSIAESPKSRRFNSAQLDKSSSRDEFGSNMGFKYDGRTLSTPKVGVPEQAVRPINQAIV